MAIRKTRIKLVCCVIYILLLIHLACFTKQHADLQVSLSGCGVRQISTVRFIPFLPLRQHQTVSSDTSLHSGGMTADGNIL